VTSDCIVDVLIDWWELNKDRFSDITHLVLNLDNGPESHSRRTQFMFRLIDFVRRTGLHILLAYYPPYHSKYNPVERCWGVLENHWSGELLNSVDAVVGCSGSMTWKGKSPVVNVVRDVYKIGVRLKASAMKIVESQVKRFYGLEKWFVEISPETID
jgi:hypothetical protein